MKHLTKEQRYVISFMHKNRFKQIAIAKELNIAPSTVCRELKRNSSKRGKYNPEKANEMTSERKERFARDRRFTKSIEKKVPHYIEQEQWSPEVKI